MPETDPGAGPHTAAADPADDGSVPFVLDGLPAVARPGEVIISAAERAGTYIPRFCYHPRMKPVGMCRMCLVEVSGPRGATLQPACFVAVSEGMEVVTGSAKVKKAQDGVLEFLLVNHPLDCPVCDKGGECPLQDQTVAYGPGETRFVEEKRHFEKPIPISDLVLLDRERCIQCARCTRFAEEIAGEAQIDFAGRAERVEVAIFPGKPFTSYFSGNTVQICPVGALTAPPYRFAARPWDLDQVESTCTTCALGCRVAVQSSTDRLTRLLGIDSDPVNQSWLCDKGRYVFESVNGREAPDPPATGGGLATGTGRLTEPMVRKDGELVAVGWGEALAEAASRLDAVRREHGPRAIAVIGGARTTNEGAYAWTKLAKSVLGTDSVDAQLADGLPAELVLDLPRATVDDACRARVLLVLSGDVREELPVLFLRLRVAVLHGSTSVVEITPQPTALTPLAAWSLRARPGDTPAIVEALVGDGPPAVPAHPDGDAVTAADLEGARRALAGDEPDAAGAGVVVVLGRASLAEDAGVTAAAARRLATALPGARFLSALRRGNVRGALELGMAPGLLPGRVSLEAGREWFGAAWGAVPDRRGLDTAAALAALADEPVRRVVDRPDEVADEVFGEVKALVVLGADLLSDFPDATLARRALERASTVIAVCGHPSATVDRADVVLPAAVEHERAGTTTNVEGRVSRMGQKLVPPGQAWADWMIATELAAELGADLGFGSSTEIWDEIARVAPVFAGCTSGVLDAPNAHDGVLVPYRGGRHLVVRPIDPMATPGVQSVERQGAPPNVGSAEASAPALDPPPAAGASGGGATVERPAPGAGVHALVEALPTPHLPPFDRYSMRLVSARRLYDRGAAVTSSPSLAPLVPPAVARVSPADLDRIGAADGSPVVLRSSRGARTVPCQADAQLPRGVVAVDFNLSVEPGVAGAVVPPEEWSGSTAAALIEAGTAVTEVRLESVR